MTPSIRKIAALIDKSPSTVMRWQTTNPNLYRAVAEYAAKHYANNQIPQIRTVIRPRLSEPAGHAL